MTLNWCRQNLSIQKADPDSIRICFFIINKLYFRWLRPPYAAAHKYTAQRTPRGSCRDNPTTTASSPYALPDAPPYRPHTVALLVAHLALDGVLRPQCGLVQGATGHRAEAMAAHLGFGVITDNTQRLVDGVFAHWLVHGVRPRKDENRFSGNFLYLLQQGDSLRG